MDAMTMDVVRGEDGCSFWIKTNRGPITEEEALSLIRFAQSNAAFTFSLDSNGDPKLLIAMSVVAPEEFSVQEVMRMGRPVHIAR